MHGFLLIDKPAGMTSHDVIDRLRRITGERRIGHAGTLDPFATGLLVVGVRREATRELGALTGHDKEYLATAKFGATSDTQDRTGRVTPVDGARLPTEAEVRAALEKFRGEIEQIPPMYSAKKIGGQKLYQLARRGQEIERPPVKIRIHELELTAFAPDQISFRVRCSAGTYVRALAHDLGQALGCGAYLEELRRVASGDFRIAEAAKLADLTPQNWQEKLKSCSKASSKASS